MSDFDSQPTRIIVVDDEDIVVSLICDALEDEGYEVLGFTKSPEALREIEASRFNLLITDIRMPHLDGNELVRQARIVQPDLGIIFMTGYADLNTAKDAIKAGASDYILKPFELNEIRQAVRTATKAIEDNAEKSSGEQLDRISDLNQMLITGTGRNSLLSNSIKFAALQCHTNAGAILRWNSDHSDHQLIELDGKTLLDNNLDSEELVQFSDSLDWEKLSTPVLIKRPEDIPILGSPIAEKYAQYVFPKWKRPEDQLAIVAINSGNANYGLMMIGPYEDSAMIKSSGLKFLGIAASQLAMSLENLQLLEETQTAYARLKDMQDETIELEKMATRGEMSAEIGHELNNFIAVVASNIQLLDFQLKKKNYDKLDRYIQSTLDTIGQIKKFTSNLMDSTPTASIRENLMFDQLISEVIEYLRPQKRFRGVTIKMEPFDGSLPFRADSTHIQQVLYNLFNNAADATVDREIREISVTLTELTEDHEFCVSITDTGVGIKPELLGKVFNERFTTKKTGHGFGLIVCARIIENHNGKIKVNSTPDIGTTISITFPMEETLQTEPELA